MPDAVDDWSESAIAAARSLVSLTCASFKNGRMNNRFDKSGESVSASREMHPELAANCSLTNI